MSLTTQTVVLLRPFIVFVHIVREGTETYTVAIFKYLRISSPRQRQLIYHVGGEEFTWQYISTFLLRPKWNFPFWK